MIRFVPIPLGNVRDIENLWMPFLELQASRMGENVSVMARQVESGEVGIAFAWDDEAKEAIAMIGWRVILQGNTRVGEILWLAGAEMDLWLDLMPRGEEFMREHQRCQKIRAYGRKGWERVMKPFGYAPAAVVLERSL